VRLRSIVVALLLIPLLATAAGAIYVEGVDGQTVPTVDDGAYHILAADSSPGVASSSDAGMSVLPVDAGGDVYVPVADISGIGIGLDTPVSYDVGPIKRYLSDDPNDYVLVPGNEPGMVYALGGPESASSFTMPAVNLPGAISYSIPYGDIQEQIGGAMGGNVVGYTVPSMDTGYWNSLAGNGLNVNMPILNFPVF
jgi:hypothetical protein